MALKHLPAPAWELVLAIVAPLGVDLDSFQGVLRNQLFRDFGYRPNDVRLSDLLHRYSPLLRANGITLRKFPEAMRLDSHMAGANMLRQLLASGSEQGDALALCAIEEIAVYRHAMARRSGDQVLARTAHILRSLKHPDEVHRLRQVYGPGFYLIGVHTPEEDRLRYLVDKKRVPRKEALILIGRDAREEGQYGKFGQRTTATFHLADAFVRFRSRKDTTDLHRFLSLVFGNQFETPTPDEHAMFLAYASSLRSASLSRQVGAVVCDRSGDAIGVGTNDVPCFGGGLYWPGSKDRRDHCLGYDSNARARDEIIEEVRRIVESRAPLTPAARQSLKGDLAAGRLHDITEYGRAVHAEMEALLSCARTGRSPRDGTLYTTTFPCHNCAKHIIAAGIVRVVYVEPYEKSWALKLHGDALAGGLSKVRTSRTRLEPFVGVGPRRYFDLFSMRLSSGYPFEGRYGRETDGTKNRTNRMLRVQMSPTAYYETELHAVRMLQRRRRPAQRR